jgi:hypothetical protein
MPFVGIGVGIGRQRFAQGGIFAAYAARVAADGGVTEAGACVNAVSGISLNSSLLLVPSGYKSGVVYSEIPTDGDGDLTFTRASSATRVNSDGLIESPRTNLVLYSEEFDNAYWTKFNTTVTANTTTSPDGTTNAETFTINSGGQAEVSKSLTTVTGTSYVFSCFGKKGSGTTDLNSFRVLGAGVINTVTINWDTGVISQTGSGATSENFGNGWYRIIIPFVANSTTTTVQLVTYQIYPSSVFSYRWGAQLEVGSTATAYIPTTNSARTTFAGITQDGTSASNVPRLDYSQGSCPALLLEPQRTNLVLYSEQFDNAAWSKDNVTVTANTATSPDGTQNADTIDDSSASFGSISQLFVSLTNATYTFSVFVKAVSTATDVRLDLYTAVGDQFFVVFNSATGAYVTGNGGVYASTAFNNGWFRFTLTATGSGNTNVRVYPSAQSAASTGAVYVWGAQLEVGSYSTSYIPTTSATVTRLADACSKTSISSLIGQTEGVVYVEYDQKLINQGITRRIFALSDGTTSNRITAYINSTNGIDFYVRNSGGDLFLDQASSPIGNTTGVHKIAAAYKNGDYAVYLDGVQIISGAGTAGTIPACSRFDLGSQIGSNDLYEPMMQSLLFPTRLTNTQLAELTTL